MSEQSGPITREQEWAPDYVIAAEAADDWDAERAALTRWRDELAAAEPVRRVARWDAERASGIGAYVCTPPYEFVGSPGHQHPIIPSQQRHLLEAAGYEIEGGPEPVRDWKSDRAIAAIWPTPKPAEDSPERLRERREALGLSVAWVEGVLGDMNLPGYGPAADDDRVSRRQRREAAEGVDHHDYGTAREADLRARYAAALSAEEARRAAKAKPVDIGYVPTDRERYPERPAPRFKVGDLDPALHETALAATRMLHCGKWPLSLPRVRELPGFDAWNTGPLTSPDWIAQLEALLAEPPPAPEVVDVLVKRFGGVEAQWDLGEDHVTLVEPARGVGLPAPLALLRAMLAAIDAQQGGAS